MLVFGSKRHIIQKIYPNRKIVFGEVEKTVKTMLKVAHSIDSKALQYMHAQHICAPPPPPPSPVPFYRKSNRRQFRVAVGQYCTVTAMKHNTLLHRDKYPSNDSNYLVHSAALC